MTQMALFTAPRAIPTGRVVTLAWFVLECRFGPDRTESHRISVEDHDHAWTLYKRICAEASARGIPERNIERCVRVPKPT